MAAISVKGTGSHVGLFIKKREGRHKMPFAISNLFVVPSSNEFIKAFSVPFRNRRRGGDGSLSVVM
jgi:hypothetical protein